MIAGCPGQFRAALLSIKSHLKHDFGQLSFLSKLCLLPNCSMGALRRSWTAFGLFLHDQNNRPPERGRSMAGRWGDGGGPQLILFSDRWELPGNLRAAPGSTVNLRSFWTRKVRIFLSMLNMLLLSPETRWQCLGSILDSLWFILLSWSKTPPSESYFLLCVLNHHFSSEACLAFIDVSSNVFVDVCVGQYLGRFKLCWPISELVILR